VPHALHGNTHTCALDGVPVPCAGNYEAAVESCFKANRLADALLIANIFNR